MTNIRKLYKEALHKKYTYNILETRNNAIAWSNNYLLLPNNEKLFNFERIKTVNSLKHKTKKTDYGIHIKRHGETDRMKKERQLGKKTLRKFLKNETINLINQEI